MLRCVFVALVAVLPSVGPAGLDAQTPQELMMQAQSMSPQEVMRLLQQSGMTPDQVRQRLLEMGLDPTMADPYLEQLGRTGSSGLPEARGEFASGLRRMGLYGQRSEGDTLPDDPIGDEIDPDDPFLRVAPEVLEREPERPDSLQVFGRHVFRRNTTQFDALRAGPVPSDYRLGPGDEVYLILTGDVELAHTLRVSREGALVIPDVGTVFANGLTMAQLEDRLHQRVGQVYSGLSRGPDATTHLYVSIGRLRMNQVFVVGEVERPGAVEVPAAATALTALYRSGGPTESGSFRRVQVRRGGQTVAEIDLYEYLLRGSIDADVRLEQGDVVFVPVAQARVRVAGEARRPMFYEPLPNDGLVDVIGYAGGPEAEADLRRVQIDRILPPGEREAGRERVIDRVDVVAAVRGEERVPVLDGDVIRLFPIGVERRDRVVLDGFVHRPGEYELRPGMTVWDAIQQAGGLRPEAFETVAHVSRLNPADSTYRLLRVSLERGVGGQPMDDLPLEDQDHIEVFGRSVLTTPRTVRIIGAVKEPGEYEYRDDMSVEDLILAAGGFREGAQGLEAEVSRMEPRVARSDTVASSFRVALDGSLPWNLGGRVGRSTDDGLPMGSQVELVEGDQVFVRQLPGYVEPTAVEVTGELNAPGSYAFTVREERLSSFVRRSGGLTDDAYADGARLLRDSTLVAIDLERALREPGSQYDVVLRPDDRLEVPRYDPTVLVQGAVAFESRIVFEEGLDLEDYLNRAGGTLPEADESRISVRYESGERATTRKTLWVKSYPEIGPGSTIIVPAKPGGAGTNWTQIITTTVTLMSATATLILAIANLP
ncbi:MAG: SLBB domain-containing protein [Gemmatimonadetes bacterium]|nr:SLBB domain-containing protein [Gemmatimonadota bacterium]